MQKARRHPRRGSDRLQARGFRVCFTPLLEVLFTFPSRYLCAIGLSVVFSLAGWSPLIPAEFLVLRGTQVPAWLGSRFRLRGCHPLRPRFPACSATDRFAVVAGPTTPGVAIDNPGLGSCAFARHYLRNRFYFLFLWVLRCFSSPGSLLAWPGDRIAPAGFPHSDIRGSAGICP